MNQVCLKKWTAVHEAAKVGCIDILQLLLQHGGQVSETDQSGVTPMGIAAEYAQAEVLDILIHNGINIIFPTLASQTNHHCLKSIVANK